MLAGSVDKELGSFAALAVTATQCLVPGSARLVSLCRSYQANGQLSAASCKLREGGLGRGGPLLPSAVLWSSVGEWTECLPQQ